jgi:transposase
MPIAPINLREKYDRARLIFDHEVATALIARTDLSHAQIGQAFGISQKVVRRVVKQFKIGARRRGPKPRAGRTSVIGKSREAISALDSNA